MLSREKLEEWVSLYGRAGSPVRGSNDVGFWSYPYFSVNLRELGLEAAGRLEWVLADGSGGYASSTVLGLNTRECHGLLVPQSGSPERRIVLRGLDEEVSFEGRIVRLWLHERSGVVDAPGKDFLGDFRFTLDSASWVFDLDGVTLEKRVEMAPSGKVMVSYGIENSLDFPLKFTAKPLMSSGNFSGAVSRSRLHGSHAAAVNCGGRSMLFRLEGMECSGSGCSTVMDVSCGVDSGLDESVYAPFVFSIGVAPKSNSSFVLTAVECSVTDEASLLGGLSGLKPSDSRQRLLSSGLGADLIAFTAACDSFIVKRDGVSTILAGYPGLGERGRDAVMALPGLTLVCGRFDLAESVFGRFLGSMEDGMVPSGLSGCKPEYRDFDSTLWLINSLNEYRKLAGGERFRRFIQEYWAGLRGSLDCYLKFQRDGLLRHDSGTWMTSLQRKDAVEVQGLWYNALRVMEGFGVLMGDDMGLSPYIKGFEDSFMPEYWNGSYLNDSPHDKSLRPNQLVVLSLDHNLLGFEESKSILDLTARELLTPVGLRTLSQDDPRYTGRCSKSSKDVSCCNGAAWPWLAGAYFRALMKLDRRKGASEALGFVNNFLGKHLREAGLGLVSEFFGGDCPHTPGGCLSHAVNSAELMRLYREASRV